VRPPSRFFKLRNFVLCVDQIRELGLPAREYAVAMADAMAFVYWRAGLDGDDVEFVLAPGRGGGRSTSAGRPEGMNSGLREGGFPSIGTRQFDGTTVFGEHAMWVLDFDCCHRMELNEDGVRKAAAAFLRNDPYFPRPGKEDVEDAALWEVFRGRFLERSAQILTCETERVKGLSGVLVEEIERIEEEKARIRSGGGTGLGDVGEMYE
jgi:hypothetical protein